MSHTGPLAQVRRLSERGATGEFICAGGDLEVHVFLQEGRVAWATSSAARFAFSRDLVSRCGIDPDTLREIVEDCRRSRRPLGETLIAWSLATHEDVRASLRMQIAGALETLANRVDAPALFLERSVRHFAYDRELTFALDDLLAESAPSVAAPSDEGTHATLLDRLLSQLPELRWAEVLRRGDVVAARPAGAPPRASTRRVADLTFARGVDTIVVRAGLGAMIGVARDDETSVWVGLGREARLGTVFAVLSDLVSSRPSAACDAGPSGPVHTSGARDEGCVAVLADVLARWTEASAACVVDGDAEPTMVHRPGVDPSSIRELAATHGPILSIDEIADDTYEPGETDLQAFAQSARALVVGHGSSWHLGAPIPDDSGRVLWLTVSRRGSQGMAWALLGATARQLALVSHEAGRS